MKPIYLDHNATTPVAPQVREAMLPCLGELFGNPSSGYRAGREAHDAVERARAHVAALIGGRPEEVVFTSGGTEANNLALIGFLRAHGAGRRHVVASAIEHPAVLEPLRALRGEGVEVTLVPPGPHGAVDPDEVLAAVRPQTVLISLMHSNNELGTLQPVAEVAAGVAGRGIAVHTDAAQSAGKVALDVGDLGVALLSLAGHKLYAPKGVGALYVRRGVELEPLIHGAGHEQGRRAGTESALLAVGLGTACTLAQDLAPMERVRALRDRFWRALQDRFGDRVVLNGHPEDRLPNTLNVSFVGMIGAEVLARLDGVAASTGSACHSGRVELSPVLAAMGVPERIGMGAVRFSLGRQTTDAEIDAVVAQLATAPALPA